MSWSIDEEKQLLYSMRAIKREILREEDITLEQWRQATEEVNKIRGISRAPSDIVNHYNILKDKYRVYFYYQIHIREFIRNVLMLIGNCLICVKKYLTMYFLVSFFCY